MPPHGGIIRGMKKLSVHNDNVQRSGQHPERDYGNGMIPVGTRFW